MRQKLIVFLVQSSRLETSLLRVLEGEKKRGGGKCIEVIP